MPKNTTPADAPAAPVADAPAAPVADAPVAPTVDPSTVTDVREPVVLNADTKIETVRTPFAGTKVETNSAVQVTTQAEADFDEVKLDNGTVIRTYTGVQPGVELVNQAPEAE